MPRYLKLRDGHDWLWSDVLDPEDMVESFARSIQREDAPGYTVERIVSEIKVYRFHETDRRAGQVSRLEWSGGHYWVASREIEPWEESKI
jgi:hypothetical protein